MYCPVWLTPVFLLDAALVAVYGIIMTGLHVPEHVLEGETARLFCKFRLIPQEKLYSLKWYKSDEEFFRLLPNGNPPVKAFPLPGVNVDVYQLDKHGVILNLSNVDKETSGRYTCEVSAEAPYFDTKTAYGDLLVIVLPKEGPVISGGKSVYNVGDTVNVSCTAGPSSPPPNVTWLINEQQARDSYLSGPYFFEANETCCQSATVELRFTIEKGHFVEEDGGSHVLNLKCVSTIDALYWTSSQQDASDTAYEDVQGAGMKLGANCWMWTCVAALIATRFFGTVVQ